MHDPDRLIAAAERIAAALDRAHPPVPATPTLPSGPAIKDGRGVVESAVIPLPNGHGAVTYHRTDREACGFRLAWRPEGGGVVGVKVR